LIYSTFFAYFVAAMNEKRTMTLNLTDSEMTALDQLSTRKDLSKTAVIRQALRLYQMVDQRSQGGQKLYFENDSTKEKAELMLL
jgi:Ribbon-helix-helix protein, copG family